MDPTSNKVIEILTKLEEINSRKMRNFKTFYHSWRNPLYYYKNFEKKLNTKTKEEKIINDYS